MRARRPVLPASLSLPAATGQSRMPSDSRLLQDKTRPAMKENPPAVLRMWTDDPAASFSAASTPQGPGGLKYVTGDSIRPSEGSVLRILRWDSSGEEFKLVKGNFSDARALVPILEGWISAGQLLSP